MRLSVCLLFLVSPLCFSAAVISGSASCDSPSGDFYQLSHVAESSSTSCGVQTTISNIPSTTVLWNSTERSDASVSGHYSLSSNGISGELVGGAYAYPHSTASAQITLSDQFTTEGPERTGIVRGFFYPYPSHYGGSVGASIVSPILQYATFTEAAPSMAFQLGQPFTLTIVASANAISDDGTSSSAQFDIPFYLEFFEADGVTPVALTEVAQAPEPAGEALTLVGIAAVIALCRRRVSA